MIAKRIKINVYQDKTIEPSTFVIANQHENGVTEVKFDICSGLLRKSYFYYALLVSPNAKCQYVVPLTDDKLWTVTSAMTKMAGTWGLHLLIKDIEMVDGINVSDGIVFISNSPKYTEKLPTRCTAQRPSAASPYSYGSSSRCAPSRSGPSACVCLHSPPSSAIPLPLIAPPFPYRSSPCSSHWGPSPPRAP